MLCLLDGNGGMRVAWAWRLCLTCLTSRTCLTSWCAPVYPGGLLAAVWYGSGEDLPLGYARQLDGNGGCVLRGRGACIRRIRRIRLIFNDEGAPLYTPWVCSAAVWFGSGEDVPLG